MKFQYSPGLIGYGAKGADGSSGLQGMSIYFTDYDPVYNLINLQYAITNNYVLWSLSPPATVLPGGRIYVTGDQFIIPNGDIYAIDAEANTFTYSGHSLTKTQLFENAGVSDSEGFARWHNVNFDGSKNHVIIDNILTAAPIRKYDTIKLYDIDGKNFTRIEFTDLERNGYNAFSLYSSGENQITEDSKSIALLRELSTNSFILGNKNLNGDILNTSLILDVSSVIHTRDQNNPFSTESSSGLVLTNIEIDALSLVNLVQAPSSFTATSASATSIRINWNLEDFTPYYYVPATYDIVGNFNIYPVLEFGRTYKILSGSVHYDYSPESEFEIWYPGTSFNYLSIGTFTGYNAVLRDASMLNVNISADLYFFMECSSTHNYILGQDSSWNSPIILHDIDTSGYVTFSPLTTGKKYKTFLAFHDNGWERTSQVITHIV